MTRKKKSTVTHTRNIIKLHRVWGPKWHLANRDAAPVGAPTPACNIQAPNERRASYSSARHCRRRWMPPASTTAPPARRPRRPPPRAWQQDQRRSGRRGRAYWTGSSSKAFPIVQPALYHIGPKPISGSLRFLTSTTYTANRF